MSYNKWIYQSYDETDNKEIGHGNQSIRSIQVFDGKVELQLWHGYEIRLSVEDTSKLISLLKKSLNHIEGHSEDDGPWLEARIPFNRGQIDWSSVYATHIHDLDLVEVKLLIGDELRERFVEKFYTFNDEGEKVCSVEEVASGKNGLLHVRIEGIEYDEGECDDCGRHYISPSYEFDVSIQEISTWPDSTSSTTDTSDTEFPF